MYSPYKEKTAMAKKTRKKRLLQRNKKNVVMVLFFCVCVSDLLCTRPIDFGRDKLTYNEAAKSALDRVEIIRSLIGREDRIYFYIS